ncbi:MAG: HipA domain-containing protein [Bdellovibrionaceae bacterium]|nr:HipA domain-containing protein [Pseudobdellovibrionaceae bacterium]
MIDFKQIVELEVHRQNTFVGILHRTNKGCELAFDSSFLNDQNYSQLSFRIPKQKVYQHLGVNLPPYFAGLIPEGLRFKALVKEIKTSEDDLFSLLAAIGEGSVGDIYTKAPALQRPKMEIPSVKDIDFYQFFDQTLQIGLAAKGDDGFAGVQEKISASMISFPIHTAKKEKSYILKLNPKDKPTLIYNEFQCLQLAKKCGLKVNNAEIVFDKNKNPGLLVERFDRITDSNKKIHSIHQEDACQFLDRYPADKYRLSYQDVCSGINEFATAPSIEILKALQLYLFSYFIGNGDLHGKNISLQSDFKTGRVQLTPIYDLICTYIYKDQQMALKLDDRDSNFKRQHFVGFAKRFEINEKAVQQMMDKLIAQLKKHKNILLDITGLDTKSKKLIGKMMKERIANLA